MNNDPKNVGAKIREILKSATELDIDSMECPRVILTIEYGKLTGLRIMPGIEYEALNNHPSIGPVNETDHY